MIGGAQILKNSVVFTEIESDFSAEIGNSNDFFAQNQVISKKKKKKKKKKKVFTEIERGFSAETVSFTVSLLYVRNYWKKTATKHRQAILS